MTVIEQSSLQPVEHAQEPAYLQSYQRLQSGLLEFTEALLEYKEALQKCEEDLNAEEMKSLNDQNLRLLSLREVGQRLGADKGSIYQLLINGELPCYRLEDDIKIKQADLEEYMEVR